MEKRVVRPGRLGAGTDRPRARFARRRSLALAAAGLGALAASQAQAQQTGLSVAAGSATLTTGPAGAIIRQTSEKAVLNWQSFGVAAGSTLQFIQPDTSAIALNRVWGGSPSAINGNLLANGQVWIINPSGVLFGRNAQVNVGGLLASTIDISNQDFLNGNYTFGIPSSNATAKILNGGHIDIAPGGSAVLAGAQVDNKGVIQATLGKVVLAGADAFTMDFQGDKLLSFAVTAPVSVTPVDSKGNPVAALVANSGKIDDPGGQVLLTARSARGVINSVLNTSGMIEARTASEENGEIVLDAGPSGTANVSGKLDVSGLGAGQTGGQIAVTGGTVALKAGATIDASGDAGGGTVAIGGNVHGAGPLANAQTTTVAKGVKINASAIAKGNGGTVSVWADGSTVFDGAITARGGAAGGNGGFAETSGATNLSVTTGQVDALAPHGQVGTWLLDPANIVVGSFGTATLAQVATEGGPDAAISVLTINNASAMVLLNATGDITFQSSVFMNTHSGVGIVANAGGSIVVSAGTSINTTGGAITLIANAPATTTGAAPSGTGSITIAGALSTAIGGATGGAVALTVAGNSTGNIAVSQNISTETGTITLNGKTNLLLNPVFDTDVAVSGNSSIVTFNGALTGTGTLNIQHGTTTLNGTINLGAIAVQAVNLAGSVTTSGGQSYGGAVTLSGDTTLADSGSGISFGGTVSGAGKALNVTTGATSFASTVNVGSVSLQAASLGGTVTTSNGQTYAGAVTLPGSITLSDSGNNGITFHGAVANPGTALTIAQGAATFLGTATLRSLSTQAATLGTTVTTSTGQTYNGAVALAGNTTLADSGSNGILFKNAVNGAGDTLTVSQGATTFDGAITVSALSLQAATFAGSVATTAGQTYNGAVTLAGNTTLSDSGGSGILFKSAVTGAGDSLTITQGATTFAGPVTIASLATQAATLSNTVTTSAGQSYGGAVTLGGNVVLSDSGSGIVFLGPVSGAGKTLTVQNGAATFDGAVTIGALSTQAATLDANVTTANGQTYNNAVTLGANVTLSDSGSGISFVGPLTGAGEALTVANGATVFGGAVTVGSLAVQAATLDGNVTTTAGQTYNGAVTLGASVTLSDSDGGILFKGAVTGAGDTLTVASGTTTLDGGANLGALSVQAATLGGNVTTTAGQTYNGAVTLADSFVVLTDTGTGILFKGAVSGFGDTLIVVSGATTFSSTVDVGNLTAASDLFSLPGTTIDGNVTTTAGQSYNGAVTIGGNVTLSDSGGGIVFATVVSGPGKALTIAKGATTFGTVTLGALSTQAATLSGNVTTTAGQTYNGAVTVNNSVTLSDSDGGIAFHGAVTGASETLTVAQGATIFGSTVTLGALSAQAATLDSNVTTTAGQTYNGAVTLGGSVALSDSGSGILFKSTLTGSGDTLTIAQGATVFDSTVTVGSLATQAATLFDAVTTTAGQSYNGPVTLGASVTLSDSGSGIVFSNLVSGAGKTLTVAQGTTTLSAGATLGALSLQAATLDGTITTTAGQTYNGAVTLGSNVTLADSDGGILFKGPITGAGETLTVTQGATTFDGAVTIAALSVQAATLANNVTTAAGQSYNGAATIAANVTLSGSGIAFGGPVTGTGETLTVANGGTTFGSTVNLGALSVRAALLDGNVTTASGQTYAGAVQIGNTITLSDSGPGIVFDAAVTGAGKALTVAQGATTFGSAVTLGALSTQAATLDGNITTTAGQTYNGVATLGTDVTLADSDGGIVFKSAVAGAGHALTVSTGAATFDSTVNVGALSVQAATLFGNITTASGQTYHGAATLGASVTLSDASGSIVFDSTVSGVGKTLTVPSGVTSFFGPVTLDALNVQSAVLGNSVTTTAGQSYSGAVTLAGNITLSGGAGGISVSGPVAGAGDLLTVTSGASLFGNTVTVGALSTQAATLGGNVTTGTGQSYNGAVTVASDITLRDTGASPITFHATVDGAHGLTVSDAGTATFIGAVGGQVPLTSLNTVNTGTTVFDAPVTVGSLATGTVTLAGGSVTTSNGQSYGAATLAAGTTLTDTGTQGITFANALTANAGAPGLTVLDASGTTSFSTVIGLGAFDSSGAQLTVLNGAVAVNSLKTGVIALNGGSITTNGDQTYGAATVGTTTTLTANSGGTITFKGTLQGNGTNPNLTIVDTSGTAQFEGTVSNLGHLNTVQANSTIINAPVISVDATTGVVYINGNVTTTTGQHYGKAELTTNVTLSDVGPSGIVFQDSLAGDNHDLTVLTTATAMFGTVSGVGAFNSTGAALTQFNGTVGATSVATGKVVLGGASVMTSGGQHYGETTLATNVTLFDSGSGIVFGGPVTGAGQTLTVANGATTFGSTVNLGAVSVGAALLDGDVTTASGQTYAGMVQIGNTITLSDGGPGIAFDAAVTGAGKTLTVAQGATTFGGSVTLGTLSTQAATLNGNVTTTGGQTYNGAATLATSVTLSDIGASGITFAGTVSGLGNALTVLTPATLTLDDAVSNLGMLNSTGAHLTVFDATVSAGNVATGAVTFNGGSVTTSSGQNYGAATLGAALTLADGAGPAGGIVFASSVTGAGKALTVTQGATTFDGAVTVGSLSAQATTLFGNVSTTAGQTYNGAATLGASVTLADSDGGILFAGPVSGPGKTLTVSNGATTFDSTVTVGALAVQAATLFDTVTTAAGQNYVGPVMLGASVTLSDGGSGIVFGNLVSGAGKTLTVAQGTTTIGGGANLGALSLQAATLDGTITTTAGQTYNGAVTLGSNVTLADSNGGILFKNTVNGAGETLTVTQGATTFDGAVTIGALSTQAATLDANITTTAGQTYNGAVTLGASVIVADSGSGILFKNTLTGAGNTLTVSNGAATFDGTVTVGGLTTQAATLFDTVTTTAGQTYNGAVTLGASVTLSDGGSGIAFDGPVTGVGKTLTVAQGTTTIGGGANLGALSLQAATLDGTITTTAGQTYNGAVTLGSNVTLADSDGGILFKNTVNGGGLALTVTQGATTFDGAVTIGALSVQAAALANNVTTTAGQSYNGAATIAANVTLSDGGSGIVFGGPVTGTGETLTVATGATSFGSTVNLGALSVRAALLDGNVTTASGQTYAGMVQLGNTITLSDSGPGIAFGAAVTGPAMALTVTQGATTFNAGATLGSVSAQGVTLAGTVTTSGNQSYARLLGLGGDAALVAASSDSVITLGGAPSVTFTSPHDLVVQAGKTNPDNSLLGGTIVVGGSVQNAGTGKIALAAGGTVTIGGASAAGNVAIGSANGPTSVSAGNLVLQGDNGYAQLGYSGGGAAGSITVALTGSLTMNTATGAGQSQYFTQIGHGGANTMGNDSGDITVGAVRNVTLDGGSANGAYSQIGQGGALSNAGATTAFSDSGAIAVTGNVVTLAGGSASGAYAQIGHGGLGAGQNAAIASGSIKFTGSIGVTAAGKLVLSGTGDNAYAQIGNGGFGSNGKAKLTNGTIEDSGDITVASGTSTSSGGLTLAGDGYAQIGNGGFSDNSGASAQGGITQSGAITVSVNDGNGKAALGGDATNAFGYAQIGNGDAGHAGVGDVSGIISVNALIDPSVIVQNGPATNVSALIGNATGFGDVSLLPAPCIGACGVVPPPVSLNTTPILIANTNLNTAAILGRASSSNDASQQNSLSPGGGANSGANGPGPLETMSGGSGSSGAGGAPSEGEELSSSVALSLGGKPGVARNGQWAQSCTNTSTTGGTLCEVRGDLRPRAAPQAVQPVDTPYSSWGNESLWQQ